MADEADPADNINRLLAHMNDDSLAVRLVRAHQAGDEDEPAAPMNAALAERLAQVCDYNYRFRLFSFSVTASVSAINSRASSDDIPVVPCDG